MFRNAIHSPHLPSCQGAAAPNVASTRGIHWVRDPPTTCDRVVPLVSTHPTCGRRQKFPPARPTVSYPGSGSKPGRSKITATAGPTRTPAGSRIDDDCEPAAECAGIAVVDGAEGWGVKWPRRGSEASGLVRLSGVGDLRACLGIAGKPPVLTASSTILGS